MIAERCADCLLEKVAGLPIHAAIRPGPISVASPFSTLPFSGKPCISTRPRIGGPCKERDGDEKPPRRHRHLAADRARSGNRLTDDRSEEHTSELQSLMRISYAVFCLKKNKPNTTMCTHH